MPSLMDREKERDHY